jgi:hypothetical protein
MGISVNHPSGIDPAPFPAPVGWDVLHDFLDLGEVQSSLWDGYQLAVFDVHDNMLTLRGVQGGWGWFSYDNTSINSTLIVTVFRVRDVTGNIPYDIIEYWVHTLGKRIIVSLYGGTLNPDGTITTSIYDYASGETLASGIVLRQGEWYAFIYDFASNVVKLVDAQGNVLASATPTVETGGAGETYIYFDLSNGVHTIDVDWFGLSQLYPSGVNPDPFKPATGWIRFFNFLTYDEIGSMEWEIGVSQKVEIAHSILSLRGYPQAVPHARLSVWDTAFSTAAIVFRIRDVTASTSVDVLSVWLANGSKFAGFVLRGITLNPDGTITTSIYDMISGQPPSIYFNIAQGKWYVITYDLVSNVLKIMDSAGNVVVQTTLTTVTISDKYISVSFYQTDGIHTIDIDWMGAG